MNASGRNPSIRPRSSIKESPYRLFSFLTFIPPCCDHTHIYNLHILFKDTCSFPLFMLFFNYRYLSILYFNLCWVGTGTSLSFNKGKYSVLHFDTFKISVQNYNIEHCKNNFYFEICRLYHILLFKISVNVWLAGMVISHVQFSVKLDNS